MHEPSLNDRVTQALRDVAQENHLTLWRHRAFPTGDGVVLFVDQAKPSRVAGVLPIDQTLIRRLTGIHHTRAGLRRILRADAFEETGGHDPERALCRFGLVACHAMAEALPADQLVPGVRIHVQFDEPGISVTTYSPAPVSLLLGADQVRLLWQFAPAERYARALHLFMRQLLATGAQRANS